MVILVLTFSVSLRDVCGKSAQVFLCVLAMISPMLCQCAFSKFVFIRVHSWLNGFGFLMPDSDQRLSAKISGQKVLIFLRASVSPWWVLVLVLIVALLRCARRLDGPGLRPL